MLKNLLIFVFLLRHRNERGEEEFDSCCWSVDGWLQEVLLRTLQLWPRQWPSPFLPHSSSIIQYSTVFSVFLRATTVTSQVGRSCGSDYIASLSSGTSITSTQTCSYLVTPLLRERYVTRAPVIDLHKVSSTFKVLQWSSYLYFSSCKSCKPKYMYTLYFFWVMLLPVDKNIFWNYMIVECCSTLTIIRVRAVHEIGIFNFYTPITIHVVHVVYMTYCLELYYCFWSTDVMIYSLTHSTFKNAIYTI